MMMHFLDEIDAVLETKIAVYLRAHQMPNGGWPLYHGGDFNISCTVKAYYALKLAGDDVDAPHMVRARAAILERGGAARSNVFTRIALALFGQLPWRGVPYIPVEIMLLPKWFFFHLDKVSYWSRTVMVPLFILCTRKPRRQEPARRAHPRAVHDAAGGGTRLLPRQQEARRIARPGHARASIAVAAVIDPLIPQAMRERATRRAEAWMLERLNGEDGLGAIFPAMVNALEVMTILGYPARRPAARHGQARAAEAAGDRTDERLLPAVRLARVGHRVERARHAGGRMRCLARGRDACARLAADRATARRAG